MEKHQFTSAETLTVVRWGLFAIDDLYAGKQSPWFKMVKHAVSKHITLEGALLDDIEENININPEAAIRSLNKLLMFLSAIETIK